MPYPVLCMKPKWQQRAVVGLPDMSEYTHLRSFCIFDLVRMCCPQTYLIFANDLAMILILF